MKNWSNGKPSGKNGIPHFDYPPDYPAIANFGATNQAASSVITLTQDTTQIEVATVGAGAAYLKWITNTDTVGSVFGISSVGATNPANYDHIIPAATVRRFVVPQDPNIAFPANTWTYGSPSTVAVSSMVGANRENGLYRRVAIVSAGISSVLGAEYR